DLRFGVNELKFELPRRRQRTEIDDARARHQYREEPDHEMRGVRQVQTDMNTRFHAERLQSLGGSRGELVQLAKCKDAIIKIDGWPVGPFLRRDFQQAFERNRRG